MDNSLEQLNRSVEESKESLIFNERALPMLIHFKLAEGLKSLVITES